MLTANQFPGFITHIRFPYYRNLSPHSRIDFCFPITALVGPNGCGKTSVLQALFGAPSGKSVGRFWFATSVDPIDSSGQRPAFIYGYRPTGESVVREVLKTRIRKVTGNRVDPDYWEPSRPIKGYEMAAPPAGQERTPAVERDVLYLNFRHYLPAFEREFYAEVPPTGQAREYLRRRSAALSRALAANTVVSQKGSAQNKLPLSLSAEVLAEASSILQRPYKAARWIEHRFFRRTWGDTAIFQSEHRTYSNAFAGSGEMAVLYLVMRITASKPGTLILLDEPEVSLHPRAQQNLLEFLLAQAKKKRLQVVFSTHSPRMIGGLPPEAISVFVPQKSHYTPQSGVHYSHAFEVIGEPIQRTKLIVEDDLAKRIVTRSLAASKPNLAHAFDVEYQPGGAKSIFQRAVVYSENPSRYAVVLDADQRQKDDAWSVSAAPTVEELDQAILRITGVQIKFSTDGNKDTGGNEKQKLEVRRRYLQFVRDRVRYLPGTPEDLLKRFVDGFSTIDPLRTPSTVPVATEAHEAQQSVVESDGLQSAPQVFDNDAFGTLGSKKSLLNLAEVHDIELSTVHDLLAKRWVNEAGAAFQALVKDLWSLV